ncbi:MAG: ribosome-associated translation inhibitor RaiA [bacterium]|nr:ribosome-associated translation inhibitor RaiA [bacterium]
MNVQITGKNMDLTDPIKAYAEDKVGNLIRMDERIIDARVTLEHFRKDHTDSYKATAHVRVSHDELHCDYEHADVYAGIDGLKDELERQLRDLKGKQKTKGRKAGRIRRSMKSIFGWRNREKK